MKKILTLVVLSVVLILPASAAKKQQASHGYPINPVPFTSVKVTPGTFWGQRLQASSNGLYVDHLNGLHHVARFCII